MRRDSTEQQWVEYLQGLLADRLAGADVRLSPADGRFGPITEASVGFFQTREGLPATGVVDEATWQALENPPQPPAATPLNLAIPFELWLRWQDTTVERMVVEFENFDLGAHPDARLRLGGDVGPLAGNGGVELLNREIRLWPRWFLNHTHRFTLDWSSDHGFELGLENEAEFGVRPLRDVELFLRGEFTLRYTPQEMRGDVDWSAGAHLRWRFDLAR
ncbi:peptidoglycan-binding domain-containing protein [Actinokineospora sp. 24-640]